MDGDRKYRHNGYQNGSAASKPDSGRDRGTSPRPSLPRHPMDVTAPRLPQMVQNVTASRCHNCVTPLPAGFDFSKPCPKCAAELHCCRQCTNFESSAHFQCVKPVPERIAAKDRNNECALFSPRVTVARESTRPPEPARVIPIAAPPQVSRTVRDARSAFEDLFKK